MRTLIRYIVGHTYKPLLEKYLSRTRTYRYQGISLRVPPSVFHPGFFNSTIFLWEELLTSSLIGKKFLELGAGSGLISILAAKKGAEVMATDINRSALTSLARNSVENQAALVIRESDLFDRIPLRTFDIIAINPPYYRKTPLSEKDFGWYCGENGEYFSRLFAELPNYIHKYSRVLMVLCDGCDMEMIKGAAERAGCFMKLVNQKQTLIEKLSIYEIGSSNHATGN